MTETVSSPKLPGISPGSPGSPPARIILHLDMDSFYASVEMQRYPDLKGKPVIVGADPKGGSGRGVVCTCSYEARAFGVRSALPISTAYTLCPEGVYLRPDFPHYSSVSESVMSILRSYGFPLQQVSIDEAFLDISPLADYNRARELATRIKAEISSRLGLSCSIGIGPGKTVAKIASDFQKPGGLTIVPPDSLEAFLGPLPVRKIPGVGRKSEEALSRLGILTIGDLLRADPAFLVMQFGRSMTVLLESIRGADAEPVCERSGARSISREITFEQDTEDMARVGEMLEHLTADVCSSLQEEGLRCRTVTVKLRYEGFQTRTKGRSLSHVTSDRSAIRNCTRTLFTEIYDGGKIRLIGVRLSGIEKPDACQTTLIR